MLFLEGLCSATLWVASSATLWVACSATLWQLFGGSVFLSGGFRGIGGGEPGMESGALQGCERVEGQGIAAEAAENCAA